jgi:hypothetical protein
MYIPICTYVGTGGAETDARVAMYLDGIHRYLQTKNRKIIIFWRALERKMLGQFLIICNVLRQLGIFYGR